MPNALRATKQGEVLCSQRSWRETAAMTQARSRGLGRLVEMGALLREGHGCYRVHPRLMWKGELAGRERVEAVSPELRLVDGGKATAD